MKFSIILFDTFFLFRVCDLKKTVVKFALRSIENSVVEPNDKMTGTFILGWLEVLDGNLCTLAPLCGKPLVLHHITTHGPTTFCLFLD